jgi:hypothetical protein
MNGVQKLTRPGWALPVLAYGEIVFAPNSFPMFWPRQKLRHVITPQQFSDWIKKRRPVPQERLQALCQTLLVRQLKKLKKEREKQVRAGRLASILHQDDEQMDQLIDAFLDQLESGNAERLKQLLLIQKGNDPEKTGDS